jgi:hypothetical protein
MSLPLAGPGTSTARFHPSEEFPPTHQREFAMSISVTENASAVTAVMALLSDLGFATGSGEASPEVVIDKFDQWTNSSHGAHYATCGASGLQIAA